jgi:hypothetical protein
MNRRAIFSVVAALLAACGSPTAPDVRRGPYTLSIPCDTGGAPALRCRAELSCGLYGCGAGVPTGDVTNLVAWSVDDPSVAALTGNGVLVSVNPGTTTLRALFQQGITVRNEQRIGVFAATPPLPLQVLQGYVYDGPTVNDGKVDGALVEITAGLLRGARAVTGVPPPGSGFVYLPGAYSFLDCPVGVMTLRVSKPGYVTMEREVRFPERPVDLQFQLHRE